MGIKKISNRDYELIQYHILQTDFMRIIRQTVRKVNNEILAVEE